jgi:hypothetical protein
MSFFSRYKITKELINIKEKSAATPNNIIFIRTFAT